MTFTHKTIYLSFVFFLLVFFTPAIASATSGACSGHGGVDCSAGRDWDGSVICNDGWTNSSVSYSSMVMCQGSGTSYSSYTSSYTSTPTCPLFSTYSSISGSCVCMSGYVVETNFLGKDSCVSGSTFCSNKYGYGSEYDAYDKTCSCRSGYRMYNNKCVSSLNYCQSTYGLHATTELFSDECKCSSGYKLGTSIFGEPYCVSGLSYCMKEFGYGAEYNRSKDACECSSGYEFNGSTCVATRTTSWSYVPTSVNTCPEHATRLSDGICYCGTGYVVDSTKTFCIVEQQTLVQETPSNTCAVGLLNLNGNCVSGTAYCSDIYKNSVLNTATGNCECTGDAVLNVETKTCIQKVETSNNLTAPQVAGIKISALDPVLIARMKGRILLQTESHGEAWYVHPTTGKRFYMKDGSVAYQMMRNFGLGIKNADLAKIPQANDTFQLPSSMKGLKGKILLQVDERGEAWYVHPDTGKRYYMKDGNAAYQLMRLYSLGISDDNLGKIPAGE